MTDPTPQTEEPTSLQTTDATADAANAGAPLDEGQLLARIALLPAPEPAVEISQRTQRRARAAFLRYHEQAKHPWWNLVARAYDRFEPVMATAVASAYLLWAFTSAMALHQW